MSALPVPAVDPAPDLLEVAREDTRLHRVGREWQGPCPRCGGEDRFHVTASGRWGCRHCRPGGGDLAGYYHEVRGLPWPAAFRAAGIAPGERPARPVAASQEPERDLPSEGWRAAAREAVRLAAGALWEAPGRDAREAIAFLAARGIREDTARAWGLGLSTGEPVLLREGPPPWPSFTVPGPGILIPVTVGGDLWQVKVRMLRPRPTGPKMLFCRWTDRAREEAAPPPGAAPHLFGTATLQGRETVVLCEGELDAILLAQEAGDLVGVATLGSASARLPDRAAVALLPARRILVAYDCDDAGRQGAARLMRAWPGLPLEVAPVPVEPPGKDITDCHRAGGDLRAWVRALLAQTDPRRNP